MKEKKKKGTEKEKVIDGQRKRENERYTDRQEKGRESETQTIS